MDVFHRVVDIARLGAFVVRPRDIADPVRRTSHLALQFESKHCWHVQLGVSAAFSEGGINNNVATITKIHGKTGLSFKITVHCGYDELYRKQRHYKTYPPPATWSEHRADQEAQRVAVEFENSIRQGFRRDNRKTFAEYAAYVIDLKAHAGTKHSTIELYKHLCERIPRQSAISS